MSKKVLERNDYRNTLISILTVGLFFVCILQIVFDNILNYEGVILNVLSYYVSLYPIFILILQLSKNYQFDKDMLLIVSAIVYTALVVIFSGYNKEDFISYFAKYMASLTFLIVIYVYNNTFCSKNFMSTLFALNIFISLMFIFIFFTNNAYKYGNTIMEWLTLNFSNPNYTAMILLGNLGCLVLSLLYYKNVILKIFISIIVIVIFYFIYETSSRSSLGIAIIMLFAMLIVYCSKKFNFKKWHIMLIVAIPIIFIALYMLLYQIEEIRDWTILGKPIFSGRIELWQKEFNEFYNSVINILFGNYFEMQLINQHNGPFTIFVNYGIVGASLYFIIFYLQLYKSASMCKERTAKVSLCLVFSYILLTMAEAGPIILGGYTQLFVIISMAYVCYKNQEMADKIKIC